MEKGPAFLFVAVVAVACGTAIAACSSDNASTFDDQKLDAAPDVTGTFFVDSGPGSSSDAEAGAQCKPIIPENFKALWDPQKAKQSVCSVADLEGYFDACLSNLSAPDAGDICKDWKAAHTTCAPCLEPSGNNGP